MVVKMNLIDFIKNTNFELTKNTKELELSEENNVSELQIHKILFIIYGTFQKQFKRDLFSPNFEAWKYGPVEVDFRKFFKSKNKLAFNKFNITLRDKKEEIYLNKLVLKLLKFSAWSLVEYTHTLDAWIKNYDESKLNSISKKDIIESFKDIDFVFK